MHARLSWTAVVVIALGATAGCKEKSDKAAPAGSTGAASPASGTPSPDPAAGSASVPAPADPAPASEPPAAAASAVFLPAKLGEKQGVILAAASGGTLEGIGAGGAKVPVPDGTVVEIGEVNEAGMGSEGSASAEVTVGGKKVTVPLIHLIREESIKRSPDGKFAVLSEIEDCGDLCHSMHYLVATDGRRAKLGDGVADVVVSWKKDGTEVAVGSGQLWIVNLADLSVRTVEKFTAPAFGPDGTLYVRDHDGSAFKVAAAGKPKRVWKAPEAPPSDLDEYGADDPEPVRFDDKGKPIYEPEYVGPPGGE